MAEVIIPYFWGVLDSAKFVPILARLDRFSQSIEVPSAESVPTPRFEPGTFDSKVKTIPLHKRV